MHPARQSDPTLTHNPRTMHSPHQRAPDEARTIGMVRRHHNSGQTDLYERIFSFTSTPPSLRNVDKTAIAPL